MSYQRTMDFRSIMLLCRSPAAWCPLACFRYPGPQKGTNQMLRPTSFVRVLALLVALSVLLAACGGTPATPGATQATSAPAAAEPTAAPAAAAPTAAAAPAEVSPQETLIFAADLSD